VCSDYIYKYEHDCYSREVAGKVKVGCDKYLVFYFLFKSYRRGAQGREAAGLRGMNCSFNKIFALPGKNKILLPIAAVVATSIKKKGGDLGIFVGKTISLNFHVVGKSMQEWNLHYYIINMN
jgi:hypothetical protein